MIRLFVTTAATRAVSLEERVVMVVSDAMAVIDPYRHNTARAVPVAETR
jgi:hypothetical protein